MNVKDVTPGPGFDSDSARRYLADCLSMDQDRSRYTTDLIDQIENTESRLQELSFELEDQKASRCRYQQEAKELGAALENLNRKVAKGAFVVLLVDGDGAKFIDELLQYRESGGAEAARRLREAARQYLSKTNPELSEDDTPIIVNVWANLVDLARVLHEEGSIRAINDMLRFARDFSKTHAEFDFVDVGKGKENADNKMRRMLNFYYNNIQCKKIIFAGCHDAGYVHDLQGKQENEDARQRLVLLETTSAEPQFRKLGLPITRFDTVFRTQPLANETKQSRVRTADAHPSGNAHSLATSPSTRSALPLLPGPSTMPNNRRGDRNYPTELNLEQLSGFNNGGVSKTYATVGRDKEHETIVLSAAKDKKKRCILYNAAYKRLDPPNKRSWGIGTQNTYDDKLERIRPKVFCNDFYLLGDCPWGSSCSREHHQTLTSEEITIHRYRARTGPCADGPSCRRFGCYSSHYCPLGKSCGKGSKCLFSETYYGDLHLEALDKQKPVVKLVEGEEDFQTV